MALSHLPTVSRYAKMKLSDEIDFTSRPFARWHAIFTIAAWLDDTGGDQSLWDRIYRLISNYDAQLSEAEERQYTERERHNRLHLCKRSHSGSRPEATGATGATEGHHLFKISDYQQLSIALVTVHGRKVAEITYNRDDTNRFEVNRVDVNLIGVGGVVQFHLPNPRNITNPRTARKEEVRLFKISDYAQLGIDLVTVHGRKIVEIAFNRDDNNRFEVKLIGAGGGFKTTLVQCNLPG
jgi:hypothetical protein